ncbi:MAG: cupin domain-containing protein [Chloroflexota bacterium]
MAVINALGTIYQVDSYLNFVKSEDIPIYDVYAVDTLTVELEPWERVGGLGAYIHLAGRSDYLSCYVSEIPAGGHLKPERHAFDKLIYVVKGRGATTIELGNGKKHTFEWGPGSLFGIPLNAQHQHFNGSGTETARFAAVTNLAIIMNIYHNNDFIFDNPFVFADRAGDDRFFQGEGEYHPVRGGRNHWETNFVPDLVNFELPEWHARGAGGNNIQFLLANSTMHAHISEFGQGTYKKAHAHDAGAHIFCVTGSGYSLLWHDGENPVDEVRVEWKPGTLYAPPDGPTIHQHFNTATAPSRYLALDFGGIRYRVSEKRAKNYEGMDVSMKDGGIQIEYEDEDPRILDLFEKECAKAGSQSKMREWIQDYVAGKSAVRA